MVMVGPTVGLLPDAFLRRGVDVLGGVRVTAPDAFLDVLAEGGSRLPLLWPVRQKRWCSCVK